MSFPVIAVPGSIMPAATRYASLASALAGDTRLHLKDLEVYTTQGPPPPWMRQRPAGIAAMMAAFVEYRFDRERLRECRFPVFYGYGDLTGEQEEIRASVLARLLPDVHIRRFSGVHHFVSPEQIYAGDHVRALQGLWARGMAAVAV